MLLTFYWMDISLIPTVTPMIGSELLHLFIARSSIYSFTDLKEST